MRNTILIVDENSKSREMLIRILSNAFSIEQAVDKTKAMEILLGKQTEIAAVLINLMGTADVEYTLLEEISKQPFQEKIPVIVICNPESSEVEEQLFSYGISECIQQPFSENLICLKIRNVVTLYQYQNELEEKIQQQTQRLEMQNILLKKEAEFLNNSNKKIIDLLGAMAEYRNLESGEHIQRVKGYTRIIAEEMAKEFPEKGLTPEQIRLIVSASSLHDIGKIAITDTVLLKPGKLTDKEFEYMKSHTISGCDILEHLKDTWSKEYEKVSMDICRHHHERYDGGGYPDGLVGEEIPLAAQIVAIADVYDALVHERVYKDAIPKEQAYDMIMHGECGVFSPELLQCLTNCRKKMEAL